MRKLVVGVLLAALVAGLTAAPALAGKKKKKTESYSFTAPVPNPNTEGCHVMPGAGGPSIENLQQQNAEFTTPGTGLLDVTLSNFQADWDLFVLDADGAVLGASEGSTDVTTERVLIPLKAKQTVTIMGCNWSGGPTAEAALVYTYK